MSLLSVIKYDDRSENIAWKYPEESIKIGSQLIVRTGQVAFFCRSGKIYDQFSEGTYTIKSYNLPLLNKLINLPFGGQSPFQAEVWFINTLVKLDAKWGTSKPILVEDPAYGIVIPVRAFGQFGFRVLDPRIFFESFIGTKKLFTNQQMLSYFSGIIVTRVSDLISKYIANKEISILKITSFIQDISDEAHSQMSHQFERFGFDLVNFLIVSINVPDDDSSVLALKKATEKRMHVKTVGKDVYSFDRSMDVMEKAASNEGTGSDMMGAAMGLGMGFAVGPKLGNQFGQLGNQINAELNSVPPPPKTDIQYYVYHNEQQLGPYDIQAMKEYIKQGLISPDTYVWKPGLENWVKANTIQEFESLFNTLRHTPPPPPIQT